MNVSRIRLLVIIFFTLLLSACSPHPGAGVWGATSDNDQGITRLTVGFEGRAEFISNKLNNTIWHCFWTAHNKQKLSLDCTPSTNPEQKKTLILEVNDQGLAELRTETQIIATFNRLDESPSSTAKK